MTASTGETSFETRAWRRLQEQGSLSRLSPVRVRIVPKTRVCPYGITINSLSRYLALSYEAVSVRWSRIAREASKSRDYSIVLVPWPLSLDSSAFRPVRPIPLQMDAETYGFFEFAPEQALDSALLASVLREATETTGHVDAVVFPESSVCPEETAVLEQLLEDVGATFLIAGVRQPPSGEALGRNYLHFGVRTAARWESYEQDKHHRWCLDEGQIRQYHLTRALDPKKLWWEAIDIRERALHLVDLGGGVTTAPLVCEDLARLDGCPTSFAESVRASSSPCCWTVHSWRRGGPAATRASSRTSRDRRS